MLHNPKDGILLLIIDCYFFPDKMATLEPRERGGPIQKFWDDSATIAQLGMDCLLKVYNFLSRTVNNILAMRTPNKQ